MAFENSGELVTTGGELITGTGEVLEKTGDMVSKLSPRDCGELAVLGIIGTGLGFLGYKIAECIDEKFFQKDKSEQDEIDKMSQLLEQLAQRYSQQQAQAAAAGTADQSTSSQDQTQTN